jgi:hypothetical protein
LTQPSRWPSFGAPWEPSLKPYRKPSRIMSPPLSSSSSSASILYRTRNSSSFLHTHSEQATMPGGYIHGLSTCTTRLHFTSLHTCTSPFFTTRTTRSSNSLRAFSNTDHIPFGCFRIEVEKLPSAPINPSHTHTHTLVIPPTLCPSPMGASHAMLLYHSQALLVCLSHAMPGRRYLYALVMPCHAR